MRPRSKLDTHFSSSATPEDLSPVDDPSAAPTDRSHGCVTRPETLWRDEPVRGGFFDPAIFGPIDGSVPHWGHLEVPMGVTLAGATITKVPVPPIADRMPCIADDPAARARWHGRTNDAWLAFLEVVRRHEALARLDVPARVLAAESIHVQHHFEDVLAAIRGEVPASHHARGDHGQGDHAHRDHAHGDHARGGHAHGDHVALDRYTMMPCPAVEPAVPLAILFIDEERVLVQTTAGCRVIDRAGALVGPAWTPTGPTATSVHGDIVVFAGNQRDVWGRRAYPDSIAWPEDAGWRAPVAAYDLRAGRWIMLVDKRFPAWVVDESDVEGTDALDLATGETHDLVAGAQRASQRAQTRDGRFVLLSVARLRLPEDPRHKADIDAAGIDARHSHEDPDALDRALVMVEVASRRPFVCVPDSPADLPFIDLRAASRSSSATTPSSTTTRARAMTLASVWQADGTWRVVDDSGAIGDGATWWARLRGASVTAWSPAGRLGAIVDNELVILDVTPSSAQVISRAKIESG
ncbi:MAG: hypothetical protein ACKV2T_36010 [Kofleriaceae bacterium]